MTLLIDHWPGWIHSYAREGKPAPVDPGAHVGVFVRASEVCDACISGRLAGLHLRDTLLILRPGPAVSFILLFRQPAAEASLLDQAASTGTGALNIARCRPGVGRWPANVLVLHGPGCRRVGTRKLEQRSGSRRNEQSNRSRPSLGFYEPGTKRQRVVNPEGVLVPHFDYGDEDGHETVDRWECQPGCPVLLIADESRYYPVFPSEESLRAWLAALITPVRT